ncbi:MAG: chemotaxis-specific protein-glutamate methyltransferase CheB [Proteobacteria bacterium]|nr:chemotaxis-specific protein-glutamate methyltransferase CheB [Pseudomonadota bacterium]MBU1649214.1 chemotaxis-specific protein-glutamate methyltransferase CheB [Pseudomonadota bacterium]
MIRVLIVDDSPVVAQMLSYILSSDPMITVVGIASEGEEAIAMTARLKPDLITMDIHMPGMNGFEATRRIMEQTPIPIIIVSSVYNSKEVSLSFRAIEAGALSIMSKPVGIGHPEYEKQARDLINLVKALADIKVVTRSQRMAPDREGIAQAEKKIAARQEIRMVAIGASTGGPPVLQTILARLPKNFPVPITIVQHITPGFTAGFASWLGDTTGFTVRVPENGEVCLPGNAYVAPDHVHMVVEHGGQILLSNAPPDQGLKPSVGHLFSSTARVFQEKAVGVLLTGMGRDGAAELKMMQDLGAITIAQDRESSIVFGMNGEAVKLGAVRHVLPPEGIAQLLLGLVSK